MPEIIPYHLSFRAGLHVGARGLDVEETRIAIPADTLFSALVSAWRISGRDPDVFTAPFVTRPAEPPFLLTSAFPFAGQVRFYPAPADLPLRFDAWVARSRTPEDSIASLHACLREASPRVRERFGVEDDGSWSVPISLMIGTPRH